MHAKLLMSGIIYNENHSLCTSNVFYGAYLNMQGHNKTCKYACKREQGITHDIHEEML